MRSRPRFIRGIRDKLLVSFSALVACIAIFVVVFFPARLERQAMSATVAKAAVVREMTAYSLSAGLLFADTLAVFDVLSGAARAQDIAFLVVRDVSGGVVGSRGVARVPAAGSSPGSPEVTADGKTLVTSMPVLSSGTRVGTLTVGISLAVLRSEVANARRIGAVVGFAILVVGLFLVYAISTLVTRPLRAVADTVDSIAAGDLSLRAAETGDKEVTQLVRAFNRMVGMLAGTQLELATANQGLEARVEERTAELTVAIAQERRSQVALAASAVEARRTSELLQSLIDVAPQAIITVDLEWNVTRWNLAAEQLFGWPAAEVIGRPLPYIVPEQRADFDARRVAIRDGSAGTAIETTRLCRDGSRITVLAAAGTLRDPEQRPTGYIGILTDLTDRKQLEDQLRQSQKMEAMGRLAGGVAHDFNNILTVITVCTELLLADQPTGEARGQIEQIAGAATRAAALTRQLLTFTRQQIVKVDLIDVTTLVREFEPMLRRVVRANVRFDVTSDGAPAVVAADRGQLEQVLMNLVVNAVDAMPDGGTLSLATRRHLVDEQHPSTDREISPGAYTVLEVRDTGIGMDSVTCAHMFEPFFTTKEVGKGTGLGLATTYGIVSELGGSIRVNSALGKGTTLEIYVPAAAGVASIAAVAEPARLVAAGPPGPITILLVDDETTLRRVVRRMLERSGYRVIEASDGEAGLIAAAEHSGTIEAVVTDMMMPGMNGAEFAQRLSVRRPQIGVVYVSGYAEGVEGFDSAPDATHVFLQKPFTKEQLLGAIDSVRAVAHTAVVAA